MEQELLAILTPGGEAPKESEIIKEKNKFWITVKSNNWLMLSATHCVNIFCTPLIKVNYVKITGYC